MKGFNELYRRELNNTREGRGFPGVIEYARDLIRVANGRDSVH